MKILSWIKAAIIETLNQIWTLLGMFIAWTVLEGSARTVVGAAILYSLIVWVLTLSIRSQKDDE